MFERETAPYRGSAGFRCRGCGGTEWCASLQSATRSIHICTTETRLTHDALSSQRPVPQPAAGQVRSLAPSRRRPRGEHNGTTPQRRSAFVAPEKITRYLLSPDHPRGGPKCAFFESFGFGINKWQELSDAFFLHARTCDVIATATEPYGQVYEVNGRLSSPDGRNPVVLVVWMVRIGEDFPRLVTAVPSEEEPNP